MQTWMVENGRKNSSTLRGRLRCDCSIWRGGRIARGRGVSIRTLSASSSAITLQFSCNRLGQPKAMRHGEKTCPTHSKNHTGCSNHCSFSRLQLRLDFNSSIFLNLHPRFPTLVATPPAAGLPGNQLKLCFMKIHLYIISDSRMPFILPLHANIAIAEPAVRNQRQTVPLTDIRA